MVTQPDERDHASDQDGDQVGELDGDLAPGSLAISALPLADTSVVELVVLLESRGGLYRLACALGGAKRCSVCCTRTIWGWLR